jgi:Iodothyronine deiodinase
VRPLPSLALLAAAALLSGGCFPRAPGASLAHFATSAPAPGALAPPVELIAADGQSHRLDALLDGRPLVLQLGSHSCPVYRYRRHSLAPLWERFAGRVRFVLVYTREAHPAGSASPFTPGEEWNPWINRLTGVRVREPASIEERRAQAVGSHHSLELPVELFVDPFDNPAWQSFGAAASPAFVLDTEGRVVLRQAWIEPREIAATLERLLED